MVSSSVMKLRLSCFVLAAGVAAVASAGNASAAVARESGTRYVADAMTEFVERGIIPGAISILYKDGVQETCCMGYADVAAKRPITIDDPFMQCSQTKGFCGVTVAMLVEDGKLSLDDPVSKYLPEFKELWVKVSETNGVRMLRRAKNALTVRMVMNHTGGFPFELAAKAPEIQSGGWNGGMPLRSVAATAAAQPLLFEPGTGEQYSNTGIDIGAAIVEIVSGQRWEDFLKKRVFDPLGMTNTGFKPSDELLAHKIELYDVAENRPAVHMPESPWMRPPYNGDRVFPSAGAGLWTTARDQVKFYKMLVNLGVGENGARILREETVKNLLARSSRPKDMDGYSLGLRAPVEDGEDWWFGHGGAFATNCMVNWHRKALFMWVTQNGKEDWNFWYPKWEVAMKRFFGFPVDINAAYVGRVR